ncbi:MAG: hypothetical protein K6C34_01125 [Alphaproteobacteria bacterium]|nr:hypothetical protein [Alphaproteobacteria bacterium]
MKKVIYLSLAAFGLMLAADVNAMEGQFLTGSSVRDALIGKGMKPGRELNRILKQVDRRAAKITSADVEEFARTHGDSLKSVTMKDIEEFVKGNYAVTRTARELGLSAKQAKEVLEKTNSKTWLGSVTKEQLAKFNKDTQEAIKKRQKPVEQPQPEQAKKFEVRDSELRRFAAREEIADIENKLADPAQRAELCAQYSDIDSQIDKLAASVVDINEKLSKLDGVNATEFMGTSTNLVSNLYSTKFETAKTPVDAYLEQANKIVEANELVKLYVAGKPNGAQVLAFLDALDAFIKTPATGLGGFLAVSTLVTAAPDLTGVHFEVSGQDTAAAAVTTTAAANEWYVAYAKSLQRGTARKKQLLAAQTALTVLWAIQAYNGAHVGQEFNAWDELLKVFPAELKMASDAQ